MSNRKSSLGVLASNQLLVQSSQTSIPESVYQTAEKLQQNINAGKFNRHKHQKQNEYEYHSPNPGKSLQLQSYFNQRSSSYDFENKHQSISYIKQIDSNRQLIIKENFEVNKTDLQSQNSIQLLASQANNLGYLQSYDSEETFNFKKQPKQSDLFIKAPNHSGKLLPNKDYLQNKMKSANKLSIKILKEHSHKLLVNGSLRNQSLNSKVNLNLKLESPDKQIPDDYLYIQANNSSLNTRNQQQNSSKSPVYSAVDAEIEFRQDQIKKILNKRIKHASGNHYGNQLSPTKETYKTFQDKNDNQISFQQSVDPTNNKDKINETSNNKDVNIHSSDEDEYISDDSLNKNHTNLSEEQLSKRKQLKQKKKEQMRQNELENFIKEQKSRAKPRLTINQARAKIQYYELETEKRARERQERANNGQQMLNSFQSTKSINKSIQTPAHLPKSLKYLKYLEQSEYDNESEQFEISSLASNQLKITDAKSHNFKYHLPTVDEGEEKSNTLESFYSNNKKVKKQFIKKNDFNDKFKNRQGKISQEEQNLYKSTVAEAEAEDENSDKEIPAQIQGEDVAQEKNQEIEIIEQEETQNVDLQQLEEQQKQQELNEALQLEKDEIEQLELCGEQFILEIQRMIEEICQQNQDNGNKFDQTKSSLSSSQLSIQAKQVLDTDVPKRLLNDFEMMLRKQAAFFQKSKRVYEPKYNEQAKHDDKISYFNECLKGQVLCFPYLNRVHNYSLVLQNVILSVGVCKAIKSVLGLVPTMLQHLYLDCNGMNGQAMLYLLEGIQHQSGKFKTLTIQDNEIDEKCVDEIALLCKRRVPDQLEHLSLYYCKIGSKETEKLLKNIKISNHLRTLNLVKVNLNEFSLPLLEDIVMSSKRLTNFDISWNSILPKSMKKLLTVISESRRLQYINLSWNHLCDNHYTEKEQLEIITLIGVIIKRNRQLLHLDLTCTGLSTFIVKELGTIIRRAASVLSIHLSGNPLLTDENREYLIKRIRSRPNEDIERFSRIQNMITEYTNEIPTQIQQGIVRKMTNISEFQKRQFEPLDRFVLQRMIGFKSEQPGSGQWYESSAETVPIKKHYKSECWICDRHIYSILLWSRGRAYVLNPILPKLETEKIKFEIDQITQENFEQDFDPGLGHVNGSLPYNQLKDKAPYLAGSFTGWRYKQMIPLHEYTQSLDKDFQDPLVVAYLDNLIKRKVTQVSELNEIEISHYNRVCALERQKYRVNWARYFKKFLQYKQTYLINGAHFNNIDDEMDVFDLYGGDNTNIYLDEFDPDTSDQEQEKNKKQELIPLVPKAEQNVKVKSIDTLTSASQSYGTRDNSFTKEAQPSQPIDESKWDIVYCLPLFIKPGRHNYLIKYKDTTEKFQKQLLKQQNKLLNIIKNSTNEFDRKNSQKVLQKIDSELKPEVFLYNCQVIARTEQIPIISKQRKIKVVQRKFVKETSVFKNWKEETNSKQKESIEIDCTLWKLHKFINKKGEEGEIELCKNIILKNQAFLKEVFITLAALSSFPAITQLQAFDFVQKCKMIDSNLKVADFDRIFIAANYQQSENPKFATIGGCIVRFELWELFVRIAQSKFKEPGIVQTYSQALDKLMKEHILPFGKPEPWQIFRDQELWCIDVNDILEANLKNLQKIYEIYHTSVKRYISFEDVLTIFGKDAQLQFTEPDLKYCFAMSKMTVTSEKDNYKNYNIMLFPEFLEFIGRLASFKFKNTDMSSNTLTWKIDELLSELLPIFKLTKVDVNIVQDENSESDDEY